MKIIHLILLITLSFNVKSQDILSLKERARVIDEIQKVYAAIPSAVFT